MRRYADFFVINTIIFIFAVENGQEDTGDGSPLIYYPKIKFTMIEKSVIEGLVAQYMIDNQLELVEVKVNKANNIKVFFDAPGRSVTIDDCVKLSRFIEEGLDRDKEDFSLMVSSSGKEKNINEE